MTKEEIEKLKAAGAAKRNLRAKKKAELEEQQKMSETEKEMDKEQENIVHDTFSANQEERWETNRKLNLRHDYLRGKRKAYLLDRDLNKAKLEQSEIDEFISYLPLWESYEEAMNKILCEMLKYPEPQLNKASESFIASLLAENKMSMTFWIYVWMREFIPNNLLRLMDKYSDVLKKNYAQIILPREMKRHLEWEYDRLENAKSIKDDTKRLKQITRVENRIKMMKHLLEVYHYTSPY